MLTLPATLTMEGAAEALRTLSEGIAAEGGPTVVVDASALVELDTSAVATLIECRRVAAGRGFRLEIRQVPERLANLVRLYGVGEILGLGATAARPAAA